VAFPSQSGDLFDDLLNRPRRAADPALLRGSIEGRSVLVTGAGGSIGSALCERVLELGARKLVLLELSEHALYRVHLQLTEGEAGLGSRAEIKPVLGSVCDARLLDFLFGMHRPEMIFHAAAFKHVPLMEQNCFAVVTNNSVGTHTLAETALKHWAAKLVLISTDKAVNPHSVMGASKRVAELVLLSLSSARTQMTSIRLGNVLGSQGSVAPRFREQMEQGGPLTVTDPEVHRYFLTSTEAVDWILEGAALEQRGKILLPEMGDSIRILGLAQRMIKRYTDREIGITFTGLRPGDKLKEELLSAAEERDAVRVGGFKAFGGPQIEAAAMSGAICELRESAEAFDEERLMHGLRCLVPEYGVAVESLR
jgi:FlaA1/EpsC-like NDP-sugar epimerase